MDSTLITDGRVIDPESQTDRIADVLIDRGVIVEIGVDIRPPTGTSLVSAEGMIVGPGFIDIHSHAQSIAAHRLQAFDGVTTALDLEAGRLPLDRAYADAMADGRPLNFGFSASWGVARAMAHWGYVPDGTLHGALALAGSADWQRASTMAERRAWLSVIEDSLGAGALGVGVLLGYAPSTDPAEFDLLARMCASAGAPAFTHAREPIEADPATLIDGPGEVISVAEATGASIHFCHVNSSSRRHAERVLQMFDNARERGVRATLEAYPYGSASTSISASFLGPDRLTTWGARPTSIVLLATGERISDAAHLREVRSLNPGAACIVDYLDESDPIDMQILQASFLAPDTIIASDALSIRWPDGATDTREWPLPAGGKTHPRMAGTFAKTLRMMVRESGEWSWSEAFRRGSLLPARLLEGIAPAMRNRGRLVVGAAADIVVIDPATVSDTATYDRPTEHSVGVSQLLVNGEFVIRDGDLITSSYPGRPIRGY